MASIELGNLIYLVLLLVMVLTWFVAQNRQSLGKLAQQALAWGLIFVGVIAAIGVWDDIRQTLRPTQSVITETGQIEVPRAPDGHYYLTLLINDKPIDFLVDTGASEMVLTSADAERAGLSLNDLIYSGRAFTANGEVRTARVTLDSVELGQVLDRDVSAWVNEGEMEQSLLGMAYLRRWSRIEISDRALILTR
ncbi:retropepsin-like aspartic protease family protein [Sedimentitalea todarodis]|uniref:TIGR02281 family clan AA aspartic protease n=1 Tax=Sedimentitalea todarodis TaxID=1631240 RepID=A0ABU3VC61_9RHOB|nr:TIGR02281 family clan AA aspartic protease [Sedimentitalea todarodis]MDU9003765.1 TIGR02281 family clan AA aspartic protease [Sedimentitalea todarodis]